MKKLLFIFAFSSFLTFGVPGALADSFDFKDTLSDFQEDVSEQSGEMQEDALGEDYDTDEGTGIELTTFNEEGDEGADIIVSAIRRFLDFFKLLVTPIAILVIVIMGARMVAAGQENEEMITKSKNFIKYALEGLLIIFMADSIVDVFFGAEGEIFRGGEEGVAEFARQGNKLFQGIYSLVQMVIGSIAIFVLVMAGMRFVAGSYNEDQISKAKKQITWALAGLFLVGMSEFVVKKILFQNQGTELGVEEAKLLLGQITNFVAGTVGSLSFLFLFYAGYLYATGSQNEDNIAKAKKIIFGAILGILLAFAAFAITNTVVELDAS